MRLLLVEDADGLRRSLELGLRREGFAVDTAATGPQGLTQALAGPFDAIVLDLMLPELDGLAVLGRLREAGCDTPVLILTARDAIEDRVAGLSGGADDYLVKPFAFEELVARIRALVRRRYARSDARIAVGNLLVDTQAGIACCGSEDLALTRREYQLLEYLALRRGEVVSRGDIEGALYEDGAAPSSNAVDSAVCRLRGKLEQAGASAHILTRRGRGYVLPSESAA